MAAQLLRYEGAARLTAREALFHPLFAFEPLPWGGARLVAELVAEFARGAGEKAAREGGESCGEAALLPGLRTPPPPPGSCED